MLRVLGPKPASPLADRIREHTASDPGAAADLFLRHGFVIIPDVVTPPELRAMQAAYEGLAPACRAAFDAEWESGKARADLGQFYSFPMSAPEFYPLWAPACSGSPWLPAP